MNTKFDLLWSLSKKLSWSDGLFFKVLYNAELLSWQDDKKEADVLLVDYEQVERVAVKDMYVKFRYC